MHFRNILFFERGSFLKRLRVAVLFGGVSFEYEVSLSSAYNVIKNLKELFEVYPIGITKNGEWMYYYGDIENIKNNQWQNKNTASVSLSLDSKHKGILKFEGNSKFSLLEVDCFFPVLHGKNGEDGKMSGIFEMIGVSYVGCDFLSGALCQNKVITRTMLDYFGIKGVRWTSFKRQDIKNLSLDDFLFEISKKIFFPIFTKPASCGSSLGISKCKNLYEFKKGVILALQYEDEVICEAFVEGKEVECAVLGGENPKASVVGEICSYGDFYDFDSKYKEDSKLIIPARLKVSVSEKVRRIAVEAFKKMRCYGLARVDFFVTKDDEILLNEINTMPGFTDISMYAKLWDKTGLSYKNLLKELIYLSFNRNRFV